MDDSIGRDIRGTYRREPPYTLDLNLRGEAGALRGDFVGGRRGSYLDALPEPEDPR